MVSLPIFCMCVLDAALCLWHYLILFNDIIMIIIISPKNAVQIRMRGSSFLVIDYEIQCLDPLFLFFFLLLLLLFFSSFLYFRYFTNWFCQWIPFFHIVIFLLFFLCSYYLSCPLMFFELVFLLFQGLFNLTINFSSQLNYSRQKSCHWYFSLIWSTFASHSI